MNYVLIGTATLLLLLLLLGAAFWRVPLTPFQRVYYEAAEHIGDFGLNTGDFTPKGLAGIGLGIPHDILAAVAAYDPDYKGGSMYLTPAAQHLRAVAFDRLGMSPEAVNDCGDIGMVQELLHMAMMTAPKATHPHTRGANQNLVQTQG